MGKFIDYTNTRHGRLMIVCQAERLEDKEPRWEAVCDCGNNCFVKSRELRAGDTKSCGCLFKERVSNMNRSHSMTGTKEWHTWCSIKDRVLNPNHKYFARYSSLGMEPKWKEDFTEFLNHIGPCPDDWQAWSIDRIDTNKGYYAGNVRWALPSQQSRNRNKPINNTSGFCGVYIRVMPRGGATYAIAEWRELCGKSKVKSFNVKKYGLLPAFAMACAYRERMIEELNEKGAGYAANHGK